MPLPDDLTVRGETVISAVMIERVADGRILMTDSIKHIQKEYGSLENAFITIVKGEKSWE